MHVRPRAHTHVCHCHRRVIPSMNLTYNACVVQAMSWAEVQHVVNPQRALKHGWTPTKVSCTACICMCALNPKP